MFHIQLHAAHCMLHINMTLSHLSEQWVEGFGLLPREAPIMIAEKCNLLCFFPFSFFFSFSVFPLSFCS